MTWRRLDVLTMKRMRDDKILRLPLNQSPVLQAYFIA